MSIILNMLVVIVAFAIETGLLLANPTSPLAPSLDIGRVPSSDSADRLNSILPGQLDESFSVSKGFLFAEGEYYPPSTTLGWQNKTLRIESSISTNKSRHFHGPHVNGRTQEPLISSGAGELKTVPMTYQEYRAIRSTLEDGGVVILSGADKSLVLDKSRGGFEVIQSLTYPPGPRRDELLNAAFTSALIEPESAVRSWLSGLNPGNALKTRATDHINRSQRTEAINLSAVAAVRRFDDFSYPITILAMGVFVFSIGSLMAVRPHELVAVALTKEETSVKKLLLLIGVMSTIDLVWTLLAHQANHITEVNPVGGVMLDDPTRVIVFKILATSLAIGILNRARTSLFARKAAWWVCLVLSLLMARWILVAGISA